VPKIFRRVFLALAPLLLLTGLSNAQTCTFTISPATQTFTAAGGTGQVSITASASSCARTATSNVAWITITFGQGTGTGSGSAGYTVNANNTNQQRQGTVTIAGQTLSVTQSAGTCQYQLTPQTVSVGNTGGSGTFELETGCAWTATSNASWVSFAPASGTGNTTISYTAEANPTTSSRSGQIQVGNANFQLNQTAGCSFSATQPGTVSGNGGTLSITITANVSTCERTASIQGSPDWITITSGVSGTGSGTVALTIRTNPSSSQRSAALIVNGTQVAVILQIGNNCTFVLTPTLTNVAQVGGSGVFEVQTQAGCIWAATSPVSWVSITAGTGTGRGSVSYAVAQNLNADTRSGTILLNSGAAQFQLSQAGLGCLITLDNADVRFGTDGGTGTVQVTSLTNCQWNVASSSEWIRVTSGPSGSGTGEVSFQILPNPTTNIRTGTIAVGASVIRVTQAGAQCTVMLQTLELTIPSTGRTGNIAITSNCQWSARSSVDWIQIVNTAAGTGNGAVGYQVTANPGANPRTGTITISGQAVIVTQSGQQCSLNVSSTSGTLPPRGGTASFNVSGGSSCAWTADARDPWLNVEYASVTGNGVVRYTAPPNTTGQMRTTLINVGSQTVTIQQAPLQLSAPADGVVNAATFAPGPVAPGEIVTIYGTGFGPTLLANLELTANRQGITSLVGDTRLLFDGVPSPMVYALENQLSAIVPYSVAGKQIAVMEVEYLGVKSPGVVVQVQPASPGIFTLSQDGKGAGAILNQDNTPNGPGARAALRNSIIQIFATGGGQLRPGGVDGRLITAPLPVLEQTVRVFIGGQEAAVTYSGGAPNLVSGLMQVNARVPTTIPVNDATPIVIRVGDIESPSNVTVSVR